MTRFTLALVAIIATLPALVSAEPPAGFTSLFNGKSLDGWEGKEQFWSVKDGAITGQTTKENPTKGNTFIVWKGEVSDFELRLKFKMVGGNSGIQYRSKHLGDFVISGYQADIDSTNRYIGILYEEKGRGILAQRGKKVKINADGSKENVGETATDEAILGALKKEDWNDYTVIAKGNHLIQKINGHTTVDVTDEQADKRAMKGLLALQLHAGPPMLIQFKDIYLKKLAEE